MGHFVVHRISSILTCEDVDGDPDCVLGEGVPPLGDARLDDVGAEHLHQHVELQRVREEHSQRHQEQGHLGQAVNAFDVDDVVGINLTLFLLLKSEFQWGSVFYGPAKWLGGQ